MQGPMYEPFAREYAQHARTSAYNAMYDRPAVLSVLGDVDGLTVLDAGCGPGHYAEALLARGARVIGFDQSPAMVAVARERTGGRAELRVHDLGDPLDWLDDDSVDRIVMALVLNYIDDRIAALRELARVLRPSGALVISTTHPMADWERHGGSYFDVEVIEESLDPRRSWPVRGWRRPLADVCDELHAAGLAIEVLEEPRPVAAMARTHPRDHAQLEQRPAFLVLRLRHRPRAWSAARRHGPAE